MFNVNPYHHHFVFQTTPNIPNRNHFVRHIPHYSNLPHTHSFFLLFSITFFYHTYPICYLQLTHKLGGQRIFQINGASSFHKVQMLLSTLHSSAPSSISSPFKNHPTVFPIAFKQFSRPCSYSFLFLVLPSSNFSYQVIHFR